MKRSLPALLLLVAFLLAYGRVVVQPSWGAVAHTKSGRDFSTYYYAMDAAREGQDPYDTSGLSARARADHTRSGVNPYFYPPPFLLGMLWERGLSLAQSTQIFYWVNQATLLGLAWVFRAWFGAAWLLLAGVALTYGPLPDNLRMGQVNLPVLLLAVLGLWRTRGTWVGAAGMAKMSPALVLAWWVARRDWRPVLVAAGTAVGLCVLSLPLVGLSTQIRFFTEILPRFAGGPYHELVVPITLSANHSIPDLYNQLWPGVDRWTLSRPARAASLGTTLALLGGLCALARTRRDPLGEACLAGAFTVLITVAPVYTYEHHLVFLLLPIAALGTAVQRGRLPRGAVIASLVAYLFLALPLSAISYLERELPALAWWAKESKCFSALALGALCVWAARRSAVAPTQARHSSSG